MLVTTCMKHNELFLTNKMYIILTEMKFEFSCIHDNYTSNMCIADV